MGDDAFDTSDVIAFSWERVSTTAVAKTAIVENAARHSDVNNVGVSTDGEAKWFSVSKTADNVEAKYLKRGPRRPGMKNPPPFSIAFEGFL